MDPTDLLILACIPQVILIPITGLVWLGARRERQLMQRLIREHVSRLDKFSLIRGGRR